jgi:AraC-like DNA-binding protein/succinate dehydrogenase hydrophobic anchor subunit
VIATVLSFLFLLAVGQGLFLAAALLSARQPEVRNANRLLSTLLLACVAIIGHAWLGIQGLYADYPHSALAVATLGLLTGPLLYLYLGSMLFDRPLGARAWWHFLPFCLATLAMLPFYLQPAAAKLAWMLHRPAAPWYLLAAAPAKLAFFLVYIAACFRLVRRAEAGPLVTGLARLMHIWLIGGVLSVVALGIEFLDVGLPISGDAVGGLGLMCFVYATALLALRAPLGYRPQPEPAPTPKPRYANSRLSDADRSQFLAALTHCMEERELFRDGELSLEQLAAEVAVTPHELSQLINDSCGVNFQEYLNRYRVAALQRALHDPRQAADSILDLALASGFNSKSALNRAFKKQTGLTPSEFRAQHTTIPAKPVC